MRLWIVVQAGALLLTGSAGIAGAGEPADRPASESVVADGDLTLFLAGDAIITQPWSENTEPPFLGLIDAVRSADVAVVNLELILHDFAGYAQADNGGMHLSARPRIARELAWAGVDMVSGANNHTFDYGSRGVLDTVASATAAGLVIAGSGKDLQAARAPAYYAHPDGTVALVSAAASFVPYGKASRTRVDMHGRPGLNPLTTAKQLELPSLMARALWTLGGFARLRREALDDGAFLMLDQRVQGVDSFRLAKGRWIDPRDLRENLAAVREADAKADVVIFAIHAHEQGPWLAEVAYQVIDAGADVFLAHGPHAVQGVELYRGRPIIYCPGDFVFQPHRVERFPVETYSDAGLADDAPIEKAFAAMMGPGKRLFEKRAAWEGYGSALRFRAGKLLEFRLLPLDLGFDRPLPERGKPHRADQRLGRKIVAEVAELSRPYGTAIRYLEGENEGVIDLRDPPERPPARASDAIASRRPAALDPALHGNSNVIVDHRDDEPGVEGGE